MRTRFIACCLFICHGLLLFGQDVRVTGTVIDAVTFEPLIGATISSGAIGTVSDIDGKYQLDLPTGQQKVECSYVSFTTQEIEVNLSEDSVLDFALESNTVLTEVVVTADIAIERKTPVAFSNIPTIKIEEELAAQDIPMLLNSTPGAYATESGGGDGDARISIRGFDQRFVAVMLDGIPVNDMENGEVYWSNWFGLDLVTQTMQVQRGLGASKISVPSVGGTINILTKGIDAKKGVKIKQEFGNNGFLRTTLGMTSGRLNNGWGISAAGSYKQGDGWVGGNYTKGLFYYLRLDKQLGNHLVSFTGFGAPQEHGQRPFSAEAAQVDTEYASQIGVPDSTIMETNIVDKGRRYNDNWGILNGEVYNVRKNYYHKPQLSLRHSWQANDKLYWSNVAYLSIGNGGGTADEGGNIELDSLGQLNLQKVQDVQNQPSILNPDGLSDVWIRSSVNNHFWYGLLSTVRYNLSDQMTLSGGLDGRSYRGDHYREVYDLLGGTGATADNLQVGDRFDFDYTGKVRSMGTFGLLEFSDDYWAGFVNLSLARSEYDFTNNFVGEDAMVMDSSEVINAIPVWSKTIKVGATYKVSDKISVFANTGWLSKGQQYRNVIITNIFSDRAARVANNYDNESIKAIEVGASGKSKKLAVNLNGYVTFWGNKPLRNLPTIAVDPDDPESDRIPVNVPGIDARHIGLELDFAYKVNNKLTIEGLSSVGDWIWNSDETVEVDLPGNLGSEEFTFDVRGVHVGDAAQLQLGGIIRYEPIKRGYIKLKTTYFGNNFADFQPEDFKKEDENDPGVRVLEVWKMPSYMVSSFHAGYGFKFNGIGLNVRVNILNLFDNIYISDARDNDGFNSPSFTTHDAKAASVFYGQGRRGTLSLQANF